MNKTIKEWFESIEDPELREKALKNLEPEKVNVKSSTLSSALWTGFEFSNTPEGYAFWDKVFNFYLPISDPINPDHCMNAIKMADTPKQHTYDLKIYNGRVKVYVDGYVMFTFNQIDFLGYYAYKNDENLYGLDIYLLREKAGKSRMDIYFKTKENWLNILKLLDERL